MLKSKKKNPNPTNLLHLYFANQTSGTLKAFLFVYLSVFYSWPQENQIQRTQTSVQACEWQAHALPS